MRFSEIVLALAIRYIRIHIVEQVLFRHQRGLVLAYDSIRNLLNLISGKVRHTGTSRSLLRFRLQTLPMADILILAKSAMIQADRPCLEA